MPQSIDLQVLARYLDRIATDEDRVAVHTWTQADPARQALLGQLETAWRADAERLGASPDADAVWARLSRQLGLSDVDAHLPSARRVLQLVPARASASRALTVAKWAAAIVGITVAGIGVWQVARVSGSEATATAQRTREYVTPRGQRASFRLADGTDVMLNAESRLRVPLTYGAPGAPRTVELQGQGYFTVAHDERRPFIVQTAYGATRDIGTRFDIRAYPNDSIEHVVVTEGEVAVSAVKAPSGREVFLRAGQMAAIAPSGDVSVVPDAQIGHEIAWTQGVLVLRDATLAEAAQRLGRWYDLEIQIVDVALKDRRVSGSYADEPISDVLTVLTASVGARYEWQGRKVTIFLVDR